MSSIPPESDLFSVCVIAHSFIEISDLLGAGVLYRALKTLYRTEFGSLALAEKRHAEIALALKKRGITFVLQLDRVEKSQVMLVIMHETKKVITMGLSLASPMVYSMLTPTHLEDLPRLKELITKHGLGDFLRKCEREELVAQTISGAVFNLEKTGEAYSIRGDGVLKGRQVCGTDNAEAYEFLLDHEYFIEAERDGKQVIFPTPYLLSALNGYFAARLKNK